MDSGVAMGAVAELHADNKCKWSHFLQKHKEVQELSPQYEERMTALHSIIAELNEKIGLQQCTTISGDKFSELCSELSCSEQEATEENQSMLFTVAMDNCSDLNLEVQRVLMGLESAVHGCRKSACSLSVAEVDWYIEQLTTASQHSDLAIQTVEEIEGALGKDFYPSLCEERVCWEKEMAGLQEENESLTAMLTIKDEEHTRTNATMNAIQEERDHLRHRVRELQGHVQRVQSDGGQFTSRCVTSAGKAINLITGELSNSSSSNDYSLAKGTSNGTKHLAQSLQDPSNIQHIFQTLYFPGSTVSDNKIKEFQLETERLNSRFEHLKSQNDLLTITLEECKNNAESMSMLMDKYESNATALHQALHYSEQCIEAYELLLALTETEQGLVLGQNKVPRVSIVGEQLCEEGISQMLKRAKDCRKTAETAAKDLLVQLDGSCGSLFTGCNVQPWENLSSNSHTSTTSSTASSCDTDFSKMDEQHLKDFIQHLKNDRMAVKRTMLKLESVHIDFLSCDIKPHVDSQRLDLENAVLMQELMAMKEEMAEMKAQLYLLKKENTALELKLSTQEAHEQAYLVQIEHLNSEVEEQQEQRRTQNFTGSSTKDKCAKDSDYSMNKVSELTGINDSDPAAELTNVLHKEIKLKVGVNDLLAALEKLTKCSEIWNQQSAQFVGDLKQANSNLVAAYEKAKKKHQNKLKKLESQMMAMVERQELQVHTLKQRITLLEEEMSHLHTNETSL